MTRSHNRIGALRSSANSHTSLNRQLLNLTHFSYFRFSLCPSKRQLYFWFLSGAAKTEIACKCPSPPHNVELLLCNFCLAGLTNGSIYLGLQSNTFICSHFVSNQFKSTTHLEVVGNIKCAACQSSTTTLKSSLPFFDV